MDLPAYTFGILAGLLWAIATVFVNAGLQAIPEQDRPRQIYSALLTSLVSGTLCLGGLSIYLDTLSMPNLYTMAAGLLTFPVATGTYYLSGIAFQNRSEFAAQFAKAKPLLSVLLSALLLGEPIQHADWVSIGLVCAGLGVLYVATRSGSFRWSAILWGLATMAAWSLGEVCIKLGEDESTALSNTFGALATGTVVFLAAGLGVGFRGQNLRFEKWMAFFMIHGILSFAIAYGFFFESIRQIGVARTALLTAFWPMTALLMSVFVGNLAGSKRSVPWPVWLAALLFLLGSAWQVIDMVG